MSRTMAEIRESLTGLMVKLSREDLRILAHAVEDAYAAGMDAGGAAQLRSIDRQRTPRWPGCTDTLCGNPRPHSHI